MKRQHVYRLLQLALLLLVAWFAWRRLQPELRSLSVADFARWRPALAPLLLSTVGLTLLHLAQAFLWRRVVMDVGAPPPDARTTVRVYFVSGLARFIPGSLWQFAGLAVLGEQAGIPALASAAAGVIGNIAFLATGVVFLAFTMPGAQGLAPMLGGVLLTAAAVAGVFVFTGTSAGGRLRDWLAARAPAKVLPALELAARIRPAHALAWTVGYGACWLLLGASFALFVNAFVPGSLVHWRELAGTMAASYLVGYLVMFAPAGIGPRELTMAGLLGSAHIVPAPAALLIPVAHRVWFFVAEFLALGTFVLLPRRGGRGGTDGRAREADRPLTEVL